jgi:diketogulonate reductase-like aldo/keto reductase
MREVTLPDGERVPALGQGTWHMGERRAARAQEVRALRHGLDLGLGLIDTAEMYGEGGAERVVGEAMAGRRDEVFVVSKVYPHHASFDGAIRACERSLARLGTDRIDLYLLHWRGGQPLAETVRAFEQLRADGKLRHWGVSNFDVGDLEELATVANGGRCATDQVLYNVAQRGAESAVLPWCRARGMPLMAYCPVEQGRLPARGALAQVARRHGVDVFAVALAWLLAAPDVIAIPKASTPAHVDANRRALGLALDEADLGAIDAELPPPSRRARLAIR